MQYRKRMAEARDPSRDAEWNARMRRLEELTPITLYGDVRIGSVKNQTAYVAALEEARAAGATASDLAEFERVLSQEKLIRSAPNTAEAADAKQELANARAQREALQAAYSKLQAATPTVLFGNILGTVDVPTLKAAIDEARAAGVSQSSVAESEAVLAKVLRQAGDAAGGLAGDPAAQAAAAAALDEKRRLALEAQAKRNAALAAYTELEAATPVVVFGRVVGKADVPRLQAAIAQAKAAGVSSASIRAAEEALGRCAK